jgi:hypothetical protein
MDCCPPNTTGPSILAAPERFNGSFSADCGIAVESCRISTSQPVAGWVVVHVDVRYG